VERKKVFSFSPTLIFQEHAAKCLAGARDKKVMDCKGARRLIPPGDALANLKGEWERIHVPYFDG